jgi:pimeloyl-ACP methyl ester carboxylesterase
VSVFWELLARRGPELVLYGDKDEGAPEAARASVFWELLARRGPELVLYGDKDEGAPEAARASVFLRSIHEQFGALRV